MRNNSSAKSPVKKDFRDVYLGIRYDKMTEQNWVSVYPVLPHISMEDFESDYDKALAELGISQDELVENGAVTVDLFQSHLDIISNFRYLYVDDDECLYGDDEGTEDSDNIDSNMYDTLYASRCMGNHTRYRRRLNEACFRARKIRHGIDDIYDEKGHLSISAGFMIKKSKKAKSSLTKNKVNYSNVDKLREKDQLTQKLQNLLDDDELCLPDFQCALQAVSKIVSKPLAIGITDRAHVVNSIRRVKQFSRLAKHYAFYSAKYHRYFTDNVVSRLRNNSVDSQEQKAPKKDVFQTKKAKKRILYDTKVPMHIEYDMPSKKSAFARNRGTRHGVCASPKKNTHITDVQPTVEVATHPVIMPVYSHVSGHGCFCF